MGKPKMHETIGITIDSGETAREREREGGRGREREREIRRDREQLLVCKSGYKVFKLR